jgi:hypothetical protein
LLNGRYSFNVSAGRKHERALRLLLCLAHVARSSFACPVMLCGPRAAWLERHDFRMSLNSLADNFVTISNGSQGPSHFGCVQVWSKMLNASMLPIGSPLFRQLVERDLSFGLRVRSRPDAANHGENVIVKLEMIVV